MRDLVLQVEALFGPRMAKGFRQALLLQTPLEVEALFLRPYKTLVLLSPEERLALALRRLRAPASYIRERTGISQRFLARHPAFFRLPPSFFLGAGGYPSPILERALALRLPLGVAERLPLPLTRALLDLVREQEDASYPLSLLVPELRPGRRTSERRLLGHILVHLGFSPRQAAFLLGVKEETLWGWVSQPKPKVSPKGVGERARAIRVSRQNLWAPVIRYRIQPYPGFWPKRVGATSTSP